MAGAVVGRGPKVGGLALGSLIVLALGVATWFVLETMFPALARLIRGPMMAAQSPLLGPGF